MRILIVSQYFWPEAFRVNDLAASLQQRGHAVTVLTGLPNYPDGVVNSDYSAAPNTYLNYSGVEVVRVPLIPRGSGPVRLIANYLSFALAGALMGSFKLRARKFDLIFVFEPSPITVGLPAVALKYFKKIPIVFWVQDLWPESLSATGAVTSPVILKGVGGVVRFIYRRCDLILSQSSSFIAGVREYCDSSREVRYFPNWAEDIYSDSVDAPAAEMALERKCFKVLFAGNIGAAQDFPAILDAAELIKDRKDICWFIVGDGRMKQWLADEIVKRGLENNIKLLGRYPLERMPSFFSQADALLVSLKSSRIFSMTIPSKLQSYMAAGIPVVGMLDGEGAGIIRESGAGFVGAAGDAKALADNVLKISACSSTQLASMGRSGRQYYDSEFEKSLLIDRLESWFSEITASSVK